ncbi:MAG: addiction module protein [Planctomycetia bacterium]|nr:addiction module protein [Planctomycetia bacterium]
MTDAQSILTAAERLPERERVHLVEALLESLDASTVDASAQLQEAWRQEVQRRSEELRSGAVTPVAWTDVRAEGERLLDDGA